MVVTVVTEIGLDEGPADTVGLMVGAKFGVAEGLAVGAREGAAAGLKLGAPVVG